MRSGAISGIPYTFVYHRISNSYFLLTTDGPCDTQYSNEVKPQEFAFHLGGKFCIYDDLPGLNIDCLLSIHAPKDTIAHLYAAKSISQHFHHE